MAQISDLRARMVEQLLELFDKRGQQIAQLRLGPDTLELAAIPKPSVLVGEGPAAPERSPFDMVPSDEAHAEKLQKAYEKQVRESFERDMGGDLVK